MVRLALRLWALGYLLRLGFVVLAVAVGVFFGLTGGHDGR